MFCKKRPSVLLEILLGLALFAFCIKPLISKPLELYRMQMQKLQDIEKQRLANLSFVELKMQLLKQEIPLKSLPTRRSKETIWPLDPAFLQIPYFAPKRIERRAVLKWNIDKPRENGGKIMLLDIEIQFAPFEKPQTLYAYRLVMQKES